MKNYRAIIVEDERLPRLSLMRKLEDFHPDIDIVECCEDYSSALKAILRHRPDIIFLDIQLQGSTTLQLLNELKEAMPLPHIIFTTAYNNSEYLLQAIRLASASGNTSGCRRLPYETCRSVRTGQSHTAHQRP